MIKPASDKAPSLILFAAAAVWGFYWLPLRQIQEAGLTSTWGVAFFNACPLIVMIPYVILKRKTQLVAVKRVLIIGMLTGFGMSFYAIGLVTSGVIRATLLFYLTPIWSTLIGVIWLKERLSPGRIIAIMLGLFGLYLLLSSVSETSAPLNIGDGFALLSGVFWGLGAACMKRWPDAPTVAASTAQLAFVLLSSAVVALVIFGDPLPATGAFLAAFPVAFVASTLVFLPSLMAVFWASKYLFPGRVGLLMMSEALIAILSASWLLPAESLSPWQWVGGIIILSACLVEVASKDEKA